MAFPGYQAPQDFVLDAGVFMIGSTIIGATRGGMKFTEGKEIRYVEFDGGGTEVAGLHRITSYNTTLAGEFLDATDASISRYFPGATSDGSADNLFTMKATRLLFDTNDYLTNLVWKGKATGGTTENLILTFPRALVLDPVLTTNDKNEGLWSVTFKAVLDIGATNLEAAPFTITKAAS